MKQRALLICPRHPTRQRPMELVRDTGTTHVVLSSVQEAAEAMSNGRYDVIITGKRLEDGNSDDLLRAAKAAQPGVPVLVVSRTGDWEEYVEAISRGAFDFLAADSPAIESARIIRNALHVSADTRAAAVVETTDKSCSGKP